MTDVPSRSDPNTLRYPSSWCRPKPAPPCRRRQTQQVRWTGEVSFSCYARLVCVCRKVQQQGPRANTRYWRFGLSVMLDSNLFHVESVQFFNFIPPLWNMTKAAWCDVMSRLLQRQTSGETLDQNLSFYCTKDCKYYWVTGMSRTSLSAANYGEVSNLKFLPHSLLSSGSVSCFSLQMF